MSGFWSRFARNKGAVVGAVILAIVFVVAAAAPLLFPGSPWDMVGRPFQKPFGAEFPLGTDTLGRDVLSGIAYGSRVSLMVAGISTLVAVLLGVVLGAVAGFYGGLVDEAITGITEFIQTIPSFIFAVVLVAIMRPSMSSVVVAIAVISWPPIARLVRGEFLSLRSREFVQAAIVLGSPDRRIIFVEILPNTLSPIIVMASLMVATAILLESALSFLGLGDPNLMSWGYMLGVARTVIRTAWWASVFPGVAILLTVLAINLVGEGLNDALNPRLARGARATTMFEDELPPRG